MYFLFGLTQSTIVIFSAFVLYGIYAAATEGIAKAWITNLSHGTNTATAIGFYTSCESICTLLASVITGWVWGTFSGSAAFYTIAIVALVVLCYFFFFFRFKKVES